MKRYIIDGYNALFSLQKGDPSPTLEKARVKLISFLEKAALFLSERNSTCIVIFDAHERDKSSNFYEQLFNRSHKGELEIIYTGFQQTADAYIEQFFISLGKKSTDCLVTSDKRLSRKIVALGYNSIDISTFFSLLTRNMLKDKNRIPRKPSFHQQIPQPATAQPSTDTTCDCVSIEKEKKRPSCVKKMIKSSSDNENHMSKISSQLPYLGDVQKWQSIFEELFQEYETESSRKMKALKNIKKNKK